MPEDVHAEAALVAADDVGEVGAAGVLEQFPRARRHDGKEQALHVFGADGLHLHLPDGIAQPHHGRQAGLQVQVGALVLHDHAEQLIDFGFAARFRLGFAIQGKGFCVCYSHSNLRWLNS